ncbi:MAG: hypothetical protein AAFY34_09275 [Pseudomonadota bacterium]
MKKLPSISATDLARIAPLAEEQQRRELALLKKGYPPFTYNPIRKCLADILSLQVGGLFGQQPSTWEQTKASLTLACAAGDETTYNLMAAEAIYSFAQENGLTGRSRIDGFGDMQLGQGYRVSLWEKAVVSYNGRPHILFIDLRSTKGLTKLGLRFAFSAQHEQIRERDPDLEEAGLLILKVTPPVDDVRNIRPFTDDGVELYSYDELNDMTRRTYELWSEVYFGRVEEEIRRAAGDEGPLFS